MTNEQYQKRILFLNHVKKNYFPKKNEVLIFYFENYDVSTVRAEIKQTSDGLGKYCGSRYSQEDGFVVFGYNFDDEITLSLRDKYLEIRENISHNCVVLNRLIEPVDIEKLKAEISEIIFLLKAQ